MRRLAPDHRAEADHGVEPTARCQSLRDERKLEGPRRPSQLNVLVGHAVLAQAVARRPHQLEYNEFVEPRSDHGETPGPRLEPALEFGMATLGGLHGSGASPIRSDLVQGPTSNPSF